MLRTRLTLRANITEPRKWGDCDDIWIRYAGNVAGKASINAELQTYMHGDCVEGVEGEIGLQVQQEEGTGMEIGREEGKERGRYENREEERGDNIMIGM